MTPSPAISGDYVVYEWGDSGLVHIRALQLSTGLIKEVSPLSGESRRPEVAGGILTYQHLAGGVSEIRTVNLDSCVWTDAACDPAASGRTLGLGQRPRTDGATVVYERETVGDRNVVVYDIAADSEQVLNLRGYQERPDVAGDFVTFDSLIDFNASVVVFHLPSGVSVLVGGGVFERLNAVDGSRVVYAVDNSITGTREDIYVYDFALRMTELFGVNTSDDGLSMIDAVTAQAEFIGPLDPRPSAVHNSDRLGRTSFRRTNLRLE